MHPEIIEKMKKANQDLTKGLNQKQPENTPSLQETIEKQNELIAQQAQTIANLEETINYLKNKIFGTSSEKRKKSEIEGQQDFFNEVEVLVDPNLEEPDAEDILEPTKTRKKKKSRARREELLGKLPVREVFCDLSEDQKQCEWCTTHMELIGKEYVREELNVIPAKLERVQIVRKVYSCPKCKEDDTITIVKAETPSPLLKHSLASPSSVAYIMCQKYVNHMPLHRLEKGFEQEGIYLSRGVMANWVNTTALDYLKPIYERLHEHLVGRGVLMSDETPCQVLKEDGKPATSKSYMWVHRTGEYDEKPIVLYDYRPGRLGVHAADFLSGFSGYHMCDGYAGYNKLKGVIRCGCFVHLRRYLLESLPQKKSEQHKYPAWKALAFLDKLFEYEKKFAELTPDERKEKRLKLEKPILDDFWCWVDSQDPPSGSMLARAIIYAKNQKVFLMNYLLDGRCSFSNNASERSVRPYTQGRNNYMFHDTPRGAEASAIIYSLVETAKAHNIHIFSYLQVLLRYMSGYKLGSEGIERLMPWSELIQEECKL